MVEMWQFVHHVQPQHKSLSNAKLKCSFDFLKAYCSIRTINNPFINTTTLWRIQCCAFLLLLAICAVKQYTRSSILHFTVLWKLKRGLKIKSMEQKLGLFYQIILALTPFFLTQLFQRYSNLLQTRQRGLSRIITFIGNPDVDNIGDAILILSKATRQ